MEIPIFIILILYILVVACFVLFSIFLIYHALRFGVATVSNVLAMIVYIAVAVMMLMGAYSFIMTIDWSQAIAIF